MKYNDNLSSFRRKLYDFEYNFFSIFNFFGSIYLDVQKKK